MKRNQDSSGETFAGECRKGVNAGNDRREGVKRRKITRNL